MWQWLAAMNCTYKQWIAHVLKDYSGINPPSERITNVNDPLITAGWKQLTTLVASAGYTHRGNNAYRNKPPQTSQMKICPRYAKTKRSRTISHTAIDTIYTHNTWSYPVTKIKLYSSYCRFTKRRSRGRGRRYGGLEYQPRTRYVSINIKLMLKLCILACRRQPFSSLDVNSTPAVISRTRFTLDQDSHNPCFI